MTDAQRREDAPRERSEPGQPRERSEQGQHSERSEQGQPGEPGRQGRIQHEGIVDLLGLLAYAELDAYFRLTEDAALAPSLADRAALAGMAVAEFGHFRLLCEQLSALGAQPDQAMLPFAPALDAFHATTAPADWLEGLVKAYVGDGIAADFYRAVAELVDPQTGELVLRVLADTGHAEFVIARVRAAIAADPPLGDGSRCGPGAWSGRRWPRRTGSSRTGGRWPACWPEPVPRTQMAPRAAPRIPMWRRPPSSAISAGCSPGSPTRTLSEWPRSAWPADPARASRSGPGPPG